MKKCRVCKQVKDLSEFTKQKGMKDGHLKVCKSCRSKEVKDRNERNLAQAYEAGYREGQQDLIKALRRRFEEESVLPQRQLYEVRREGVSLH